MTGPAPWVVFARLLLPAAVFSVLAAPLLAGADGPPDLSPVTHHEAPDHAPVPVVRGEAPRATLVRMDEGSKPHRVAVEELRTCVERATGVTLPVTRGAVPDGPAIVVGGCEAAARHGLDPSEMEAEAFHIKTAEDRVFIVGRGNGTAWGVFAFLERFLGVRWYWPAGRGGRSVPTRDGLRVEPTWIPDAPVFRKREIFPPAGRSPYHDGRQNLSAFQTKLRAGSSWPMKLVVHGDRGLAKVDAYRQKPEMWQLNKRGERERTHPCYTAEETVDAFLREIARHERGKEARIGIRGHTVTVSPADVGIACHCDDCRSLWRPDAGEYGRATRIMASFVKRLGERMKKAYPEKRILFLPYQNYTIPPEDITLPDNVYVQMCHMPGLALYKEPEIRERWQGYVDGWVKRTGHPIQDWHYSCWPADRTRAPYQYPHVVNDYYTRNRETTVGSFINGTGNHWPRFHFTLYCWMKSLWDPAFDVDAAMREYTRRMYGDAAETVHEILRLQTRGWEESRWKGRFSAKALYREGYPKKVLERIRKLLEKARKQVEGDGKSARRLAYFAAPFEPFFEEYAMVIEGKGKPRVVFQKVAENPVVDGNLDDDAWNKAPATHLVTRKGGKEADPAYPTKVRGVYTLDGITLGFEMAEPAPGKLATGKGSEDTGVLWHNDCVEVFLDPTEENADDFYQLIVTADLEMYHAHAGDTAWDPEGVKAATHTTEDAWTMEIFIPLAALDGVDRLGTTKWSGQLTRHRHGRGKPGSGENQRLNYETGDRNASRADFCPIHFRE